MSGDRAAEVRDLHESARPVAVRSCPSRFDAELRLSTAYPVPNQRGGALDALRFAAAFLIVVYHLIAQAPVPLESWPAPFHRGYLATDFFLMLSGYVLARAYGRKLASGRLSWGAFMARRLKRIWPAHLVVLGGFVLVLGGAAAMGVTPQEIAFRWDAFVAQALLVQAWGVLPWEPGWNTVTWSLSALVVCYAAFPWLWRLQMRLRQPWTGLALAVAALFAADLACQALFHRPLYDLPARMALLRALPLFMLGMALARAAAERPLPRRLALSAGVGALAVLAGAQALGRLDLLSIACIAVVVFAAGSRPVARPWPLAAFGARVSFSLFLTHLLSETMLFGGLHALEARIVVPVQAQWAVWWAAFPLALAVAVAFDGLADQPLQRWLNGDRARGRLPGGEGIVAARLS